MFQMHTKQLTELLFFMLLDFNIQWTIILHHYWLNLFYRNKHSGKLQRSW